MTAAGQRSDHVRAVPVRITVYRIERLRTAPVTVKHAEQSTELRRACKLKRRANFIDQLAIIVPQDVCERDIDRIVFPKV